MTNARLRSRDVIAERTYSTPEGDFTVRVRIGRPRRIVGTAMYSCIAELREPGRVWSRALVGADAFEALQVALVTLGVDLQHISELLGRRLVWPGSVGEALGLPTYPDFSIMSLPNTKE